MNHDPGNAQPGYADSSPYFPYLSFASLSPMMTYNSQKNETFWLGLLNRSEARVLSSDEERALLVELVDCKTRILERPAPA